MAIGLSEVRDRCEQLQQAYARRSIPPQVRARLAGELGTLLDEVCAAVQSGTRDAGEIAKYALLHPVIHRGIVAQQGKES